MKWVWIVIAVVIVIAVIAWLMSRNSSAESDRTDTGGRRGRVRTGRPDRSRGDSPGRRVDSSGEDRRQLPETEKDDPLRRDQRREQDPGGGRPG